MAFASLPLRSTFSSINFYPYTTNKSAKYDENSVKTFSNFRIQYFLTVVRTLRKVGKTENICYSRLPRSYLYFKVHFLPRKRELVTSCMPIETCKIYQNDLSLSNIRFHIFLNVINYKNGICFAVAIV